MVRFSITTSLISALSLSLWILPASAEIRSIEGSIEAAASFIHYSEGFIASPGYVDVGGLTFTTIDDNESKDQSSQVRRNF